MKSCGVLTWGTSAPSGRSSARTPLAEATGSEAVFSPALVSSPPPGQRHIHSCNGERRCAAVFYFPCACIDWYLSPPELIPLLGHPPVGVAHHGDQQVEQQDVGHHGEGAVQHVNDGRCGDGVVHRQVDQAHAELELGEEGDGERAVGWHGVRLLGHVHHPQSWSERKSQHHALIVV